MKEDEEEYIVYCDECGHDMQEEEAIWDDGEPYCCEACLAKAKAEADEKEEK